MNSTELYIAAADALGLWHMSKTEPCVLSIQSGKVVCSKAPDDNGLHNNPLYITRFEIKQGMKQNRWNSIGSALHELYCKEIACQTHQKH